MRQLTGSPWSLLLAGMVALSIGDQAVAGDAEPQSDAKTTAKDGATVPPVPSKVRFNPAVMPKVGATVPAVGWRYAKLSHAQTRVLRRGFKLPMDSLAAAGSPNDLMGAAVVAPLPDPNRPILAVDPAPAGSSDPFSKSMSTSLREDPMKALGQLLGADESSKMSTEAFSGSGSADPFATGDSTADETEAMPTETEASDEVSDDDPFGSDGEDPFGDF